MMLLQCFVIILLINFSSGTACYNGYISSASLTNGLFQASFCKGGVFHMADSVLVCSCNDGNTCLGENGRSYNKRYAISMSTLKKQVILQYCNGFRNPCCSKCTGNGQACMVTVITEATYRYVKEKTPRNSAIMFSSCLQMTFF